MIIRNRPAVFLAGVVLAVAAFASGCAHAQTSPTPTSGVASVTGLRDSVTPGVSQPTAPRTSATPAPSTSTARAAAAAQPRSSAVPKDPAAAAIGVALTEGAGSGKVVVQPNPDGCDHAYGDAGQCIPLRAGGGGPVTCAYLTQEGFFRKPLLVHADPLGLMSKKSNVIMGIAADGQTMTVSRCTD